MCLICCHSWWRGLLVCDSTDRDRGFVRRVYNRLQHELLLRRRALCLSVSRCTAVPTNRHFALALHFGLLSSVFALHTKSFFSLTFGLSFPVALVHSVDLHGVIEGSMVLSWVPLSGHMVLNERIPDTCIRGFRTRMELHFGSQRGCQRFHQNADLSVDSKGFFRGSRIFDTKVPNLEFFTVRRANRGLSLCSGVRGSCCQLLARIASKVFAMLRIRIGRQCSGRCAVLRQTWRWPA